MKKRKLKILLLVIILTVLAGSIFAYWYFLVRDDSKDSNDKEKKESEETLVFVSDDIPPALASAVLDAVKEEDWKETSDINKAEGTVEILPNVKDMNSKDSHLFQIWVLSKNWNKLGDSDPTKISFVSDSIDFENPGEIIGENYSFNGVSTNGLCLITLQEADSTRITVPIEDGYPFNKEVWQNQSYKGILAIRISGSEKVRNGIELYLRNTNFYSEFNYLDELPKPEDFVEIVKTGTTVAGGPGWELCERRTGTIDYPIQEVKDFLAAGDITIISNESSFVDGCSQGAGTTAFCGKPKYMQNLLDIGTDVISLTGNHMADYGRTAYSETLDSYTQNGMKYFAAGQNDTEAWTPLVVETNAGKIAFIGLNKMGPAGVLATESLVGSASYDSQKLADALKTASETADIVWVDTHLWPEYGTTPGADQLNVSHEAIDGDNGADIVTGVSSHEIQGMELYNGKPVFFGLGNFLFDQMWSLETRQGLVLKVQIYDKKIRNIEIHPTILHDNCQPRFYEGTEKDEMLRYVRDISSFSGS